MPKLKLLVAFYQCVIALPSVYHVSLPQEYFAWMRWLDVFAVS